MRANKITNNGEVLLDLTADTVTEADVAVGKTFHKADGSLATGTRIEADSQEKEITITENGTTEITPDEGKLLSKVAVTTNVELEDYGSQIVPYVNKTIKVADCRGEKTIPPSCFTDYNTLVDVIMPEVTSIGTNAFQNCIYLELTELPKSLVHAQQACFYGCSSLAIAEFPDTMTTIGTYAFYGCVRITATKLPSQVKTLSNSAFYGCTKLAITEIPSVVKTIGTNVFNGCNGITSLTFKGTPTSIGNNAFTKCTNLLTINVPWAEGEVADAPWGATNATINYNYTGG